MVYLTEYITTGNQMQEIKYL